MKPAAIPEQLMRFTGKARVFGSEGGLRRDSGRISVRGPWWCCAMRDRREVPACRDVPADGSVWKDGPVRELRGGHGRKILRLQPGMFWGHISPEAYEGGVLALVEDGDSIAIDVPAGSLELLVDDEEQNEAERWVRLEKDVRPGHLNTYRRISKSAAQGRCCRIEFAMFTWNDDRVVRDDARSCMPQ